jgi:hypothetical protein
MGKKNLVVRNPLGQRQALTPEPIRPQQATQDDTKEVSQQRNMETNTPSSVSSTTEQKQHLPPTKRYATYLRPDSIKQIQHYAIEQELTDYEVVQAAIDEYFEQRKQK